MIINPCIPWESNACPVSEIEADRARLSLVIMWVLLMQLQLWQAIRART